MSRLMVLAADSGQMLEETSDRDTIANVLGDVGVRFERWQATVPIRAGMAPQEILDAYREPIDRLKQQEGYLTDDEVSLLPDNPQKDEFRKKFLDEHTHGEDEVRFFVDGRGLFYLHVGDKVYGVLCEREDLISVPAGTTHWFDMGPEPHFTAIRLFNNPEGWQANFPGNDSAQRFPLLDEI